MTKSATAGMTAALARTEDVEPISIVEVTWPSPIGIRRYGDLDLTLGSWTIEGRISELGSIRAAVGPSGVGVAGVVSVRLIDEDLALQTLVNQVQAEGASVRVLQHVAGLAQSDVLELLVGKIGSPVVWSEEDRTLAFDIVGALKSEPASVHLDQDDDASVADEADGVPWPICFGTPRDVPAVLVTKGPETELLEDIDNADTSADVEDGESLFGSSSMEILLDDELVQGSFSGDTLSITQRNKNKFSITTAARAGGADQNNPFVLWITDGSKNCVGNYVVFGVGQVPGFGNPTRANFCVAQKGSKLVFADPWHDNTGTSFWFVGSGVSGSVRRHATQWLGAVVPAAERWYIKAGARVRKWSDMHREFVCNQVASSAVLRVRAWRRAKRDRTSLEERRLVPVPASYYTVDLSDSGILAGQTPTTVRFPTPLTDYGEGWDSDEVFVSLTSTLSANTATGIASLIQLAGLTADVTAFNTVAAKVAKYRSDCADWSGRDTLEIAADMAWQARCALSISGLTVKIRYLSEAASPDAGAPPLAAGTVLEASADDEHTDVEDMTTVLVGRYRKNYGEEEFRSGRTKRPYLEVRKQNNQDLYGRREMEREFWIYQRRSNVKKSVQFWINRLSRVWRQGRVQALLPAMVLEPWDPVVVSVQGVLPDVTGWVQAVEHSTMPHRVTLLVWTPIESGSAVVSASAYLSDAGDTQSPDPALKLEPGHAEIARVTPIPFQSVAESVQQAMPVEVVSKISTSKYVVELYPNGLGSPSSGTAVMLLLKTGGWGGGIPNGTQGVAWRMPDGTYISDVFAQS